MIIEYGYSNRKNKKYYVKLNNNKIIHFGYKYGNTYLNHHDINKRTNYLKRHYNNEIEKYLIDNLIIETPAVLSAYLLWGPFTDITNNIHNLNALMAFNKGYIFNNKDYDYVLI